MKATKIKMKYGKYNSYDVMEIDSIYITECQNPGYFKKENLYDYLKKNPGTIQVNRYPYPNVIPAISYYGEKYVKSSPNEYGHDNLLSLPRE